MLLIFPVRLMTYAKPSMPKAVGGATRADAAQAQPLGSSVFVEATTAENTGTKAKVNSQEDIRDHSSTPNAGNDNDSVPDGVGGGSGNGNGNGNGNKLHYTGEFFVETLSTLSGRERGSFVDHHSAAASNKLPISWFSSLQRNDANHNGDYADDDDDDSRDFEAEKNDFDLATSASDEENFAFGHIYEAIGSGHGHFQQQQQQQQQQMFASKWLQQSWDKATNRRSQNNSSRNARKMCPENKWHGSAKSQQQRQQHKGHRDSSGAGSSENHARGEPGVGSASASARDDNNTNTSKVYTESMGFWMLNELCEQDDTIEFR